MGANYKWSHWCSTPIDRSELMAKVLDLEKALDDAQSKQPVTITVAGSSNIKIDFPPELFAELVAIMKLTMMSED
jgi:hypothetical protein